MKLRVTENLCVIFDFRTYIYIYIYIQILKLVDKREMLKNMYIIQKFQKMAALCMIKLFLSLFFRQIGMLKSRFLLRATLLVLLADERPCSLRLLLSLISVKRLSVCSLRR